MREITDKEIRDVENRTPAKVLDTVYADEVSLFSMKLAGECGIKDDIKKGIIIGEIQLLLLNICTETETVERISEQVGISHESAAALLQKFIETMQRVILPKLRAPENDEEELPADLPIEKIPGEGKRASSERAGINRDTLSGSVPIANRAPRENVALRNTQTSHRSFGESTSTRPLTKEEVLGALAPKRPITPQAPPAPQRNTGVIHGYEQYRNDTEE